MTTSILTGEGNVTLPPGAVTLIAEGDYPDGSVELVTRPAVTILRPKAGMLVVPALVEPVTVRAQPAKDPVFAVPTIVHISALVASPNNAEPDRVNIPGIDISGLPGKDVVRLAPQGHETVLHRCEGSTDLPLTELGRVALAAARRVLGPMTDHLPAGTRLEVRVDTSASMLVPTHVEAVPALVDVLAGLAAAVSGEKNLTVTLASASDRQLTEPLANVAQACHQVLEVMPPTCGFVGVGDRPVASVGRGVTYLITDAVPPDYESLVASQDETSRYCLVLVADAGSVDTVPSGMPVALFDPSVDPRPSVDLLRTDAIALERLVAELLAPVTGAAIGGTL